MWSKIKKFFSEIWWIVLVPIGIFVLHVIFKKETPELDKLIKEKKEEIKDFTEKVENSKKEAEEVKSDLKDSVEKANKVNIQISTKAEDRDQKAEEFFK